MEDLLLFIEYDVNEDGEIELVALINASEENGEDPNGEAWLAWRAEHEDAGMGCVGVSHEDLKLMEATEEPEELLAIVERIILADRATKEQVPS
jgi:hypothetical protein